jgi:small GTP-binding protein
LLCLKQTKGKTAFYRILNIEFQEKDMNTNNNNRIPTKNEFKIVLAGNVGSGKTTSIQAISQIPVMGTETKATEADVLHRKATTTTAMEYGMVRIDSTKLHLYGTPGQRRFDFMTDILCKGASGMVVMIDNGCQQPMAEIDYYLNQHSHFLRKYPGIIAITHYDDLRTSTTLLDYHRYILEHGFTCPVMRLDARKKPEIESLLLKLLSQIEHFKTGKSSDNTQFDRLVA